MKFADLLRTHNIPFESEGRNCRPGWLQMDCPFCKRHLYLGYNLSAGYFNCWKCGPQNVLEVLVQITGKSWKEFRGLLAEVDLLPGPAKPKRGGLKLPKAGELLPAHRKYLIGRGFDPDELETLWRIAGIGLASRLPWRILIPIHYLGQVVSWTSRAIGDRAERYISASPKEESINHKELLYGQDYVRHAMLIHEGPTDVWAVGPGSVATLGTGYSRAQLLKMSKYPVRAICFDNEPQALDRARQLADLLEVFPGKTYVVQIDAKDTASAPRKEIRKLRRAFLKGY